MVKINHFFFFLCSFCQLQQILPFADNNAVPVFPVRSDDNKMIEFAITNGTEQVRYVKLEDMINEKEQVILSALKSTVKVVEQRRLLAHFDSKKLYN